MGGIDREASDGGRHRVGPTYREDSSGNLTELGVIYREDGAGNLHIVYDARADLSNLTATDDSDDCSAIIGNTGPAILLEWDEQGRGVTVDHIDILRNTNTSLSGASQIATTAYNQTPSYRDDTVDAGTTYYYWIRLHMNDGTTKDTTGYATATTCTGNP